MSSRTKTPNRPLATVRIYENRPGERHAGLLRAWVEQEGRRGADICQPLNYGLSSMVQFIRTVEYLQSFDVRIVAPRCLIESAIERRELSRGDVGRVIHPETALDPATGRCAQCGEPAHV